MDSTLISGKRYLFAYCITDGALDDMDMSEEQRTALILDITEIKEEMLRCAQKKNNYFFIPVRPNKSLFVLTARTNGFKRP